MNLKRILLPAALAAALAGADKTPVTDDTITDKIMMKLAADQIVKGGALKVDVKNGAVTLTGKVDTEGAKGKAERLAHKVGGVKSVDNKLQVVHR